MYTMKHEESREGEEGLPFEAATGYLLARLGSLAGRSWTAMLRRHGLTAHQHGVLLALRSQGPITQHRLAKLIAVDARNVVPVLDGLIERGLLDRHIDPADRRRRILRLTEHGHAIGDDLARSATTIENDFLAALTPEDQATLNRILQTLHTSLTT
jgi:DNA-binding MarR family transcriptional regulator